MAELVSSIITIATLGLAAIKECAGYIEAVRTVDKLVDRLLEKITNLHEMVRHVNLTHHKAEADESSESSKLVRDKIILCRQRLRQIKPRIVDLASLNSETLMEKTILKRNFDQVTRDIEFAVQDINNYMADINTLFNCWRLELAHSARRHSEISRLHAPSASHRRASESMRPQSNPFELRGPLSSSASVESNHELHTLVRTQSAARSDFHSPPSTFSQSPLDDTESVSSAPSSAPPKDEEEWKYFHSKILKCIDDEFLVDEIRSMLEHAPDAVALANIPGKCQRVPLHIAAQRGFRRVACVLLEFDADINAKDTEPSSVLDHALANRQTDFVAFLLEHHVDETGILERNIPALRQAKSTIKLQTDQVARRSSVPVRNEGCKFSFIRRRKHST
ncbi:hypothetical protein ACJQWK_07290 [Exserohilum turcicum]